MNTVPRHKIESYISDYRKNGYVVIPNIVTRSLIETLKRKTEPIILDALKDPKHHEKIGAIPAPKALSSPGSHFAQGDAIA